jgi:hypothetical protein
MNPACSYTATIARSAVSAAAVAAFLVDTKTVHFANALITVACRLFIFRFIEQCSFPGDDPTKKVKKEQHLLRNTSATFHLYNISKQQIIYMLPKLKFLSNFK